MAKEIKFNKTEQTIISGLAIGTENEIVANPYSGETIELKPLEVAVYDYVKGCEAMRLHDKMRVGISIFIKLNAKAYKVLLD
jgi:hypothetical protein